MRKLSKTLHQILSIVVGIFISIICFSGAMLIFENEFTEWQNPHLYNVTPLESGARPLTSLLPEILATQPQGAEITYLFKNLRLISNTICRCHGSKMP